MFDFLVVGAGFAGAVVAEQMAGRFNKKVLVVDKSRHISEVMPSTIVMPMGF